VSTPPRSLGGRARRVAPVLVAGLVVLILVGFGLGELSRHVTNGDDLAAVRDLARERTGALTSIAHILSALGRTIVIAPLAVVTAAVLYRSGRNGDAALLIVNVAGASVLSNVDKALVQRPRPPFHHLESVSSWSFPSGHATASSAFYLAFALVLSQGHRRARVVAVTAAAFLIAGVALSRVYLAVHYPADVAGGILLGVAWCLFTYHALSPPTGAASRSARDYR
jgi:undecaprenyl-diphosphatase